MSNASPTLQLERKDVGDVTILRTNATLLPSDASTDALFAQAYSVVDESKRAKLILNLDKLEFLASVAIGKLITLMRKARSAGGTLVLCNVSKSIFGVLEITKLSDILHVYPNEPEAIQSFG